MLRSLATGLCNVPLPIPSFALSDGLHRYARSEVNIIGWLVR